MLPVTSPNIAKLVSVPIYAIKPMSADKTSIQHARQRINLSQKKLQLEEKQEKQRNKKQKLPSSCEEELASDPRVLIASTTSDRSKLPEGMLSGNLFSQTKTDEDGSDNYEFVGSQRFSQMVSSDNNRPKGKGRPDVN